MHNRPYEDRVAAAARASPTASPGGWRASHGNYFVADHLGSVVGLFNATGAWAGGYSYTPYGERRFTASGLGSNNWRFAGTFEQFPNLYKMGARYYDATTGRFTQMDPTGQEPNPYTYAQANPCNNIDRTGTLTCSEIVGLVGLGHTTIWGLALTTIALGPLALGGIILAQGFFWWLLSNRGCSNL